jgi:hypothetical protein
MKKMRHKSLMHSVLTVVAIASCIIILEVISGDNVAMA